MLAESWITHPAQGPSVFRFPFKAVSSRAEGKPFFRFPPEIPKRKRGFPFLQNFTLEREMHRKKENKNIYTVNYLYKIPLKQNIFHFYFPGTIRNQIKEKTKSQNKKTWFSFFMVFPDYYKNWLNPIMYTYTGLFYISWSINNK